jgi:hypothetical protein
MSQLPNPSTGAAEIAVREDGLADLSEKIWRELSEQVPRDQIDHLVFEAAAQFEDATVTTFVPLLIQRQVRERLQATTALFSLQESAPEVL